MGLKWGWGDRQAGPCMCQCMGGSWVGAWVVVMLWFFLMQCHTTWIGVGVGNGRILYKNKHYNKIRKRARHVLGAQLGGNVFG